LKNDEEELLKTNDEIWTWPKRSSFIQFVGLVEILSAGNFHNTVWNKGKEESVATKMRQKRLTSGRNFSAQSVRTLFANGPKFLGFSYVENQGPNPSENSRKLIVTDAGRQLAAEGLLDGGDYPNIDEWAKNYALPQSRTLITQLMKLVLNNPITKNNGDFRIFPFKATLQICLELGHLDIEEIGYIVFTLARHNQLQLVLERIRNFRGLQSESRRREIEAFKSTDAGINALVRAPMASYFMNFCEASGLFTKSETSPYPGKAIRAITISDRNAAMKALEEFDQIEPFDFIRYGDVPLWIEYFGDPNKKYPPKIIELSGRVHSDQDFLVEVTRNNIRKALVWSRNGKFALELPAFHGDLVEVNLTSKSANKLTSQTFEIGIEDHYIASDFEVTPNSGISESSAPHEIGARLIEIQNNGWDDEFLQRLSLIQDVTGVNHKHNRTKGGRLEYLAYKILDALVTKGVIDFVKWYGQLENYEIPGPAAGGKAGNPDVIFEIDDITCVLELTTIRGTAAQWTSSEAASVPDHIKNYENHARPGRILGFFIAPSINNRVNENFVVHGLKSRRPIICLEIAEFVNLTMLDRSSLKSKLEAYLSSIDEHSR
jgi:hypothetical protein